MPFLRDKSIKSNLIKTILNVMWHSMEIRITSGKAIFCDDVYQRCFIKAHQLEEVMSQIKCWVNYESIKGSWKFNNVKEMCHESSSGPCISN